MLHLDDHRQTQKIISCGIFFFFIIISLLSWWTSKIVSHRCRNGGYCLFPLLSHSLPLSSVFFSSGQRFKISDPRRSKKKRKEKKKTITAWEEKSPNAHWQSCYNQDSSYRRINNQNMNVSSKIIIIFERWDSSAGVLARFCPARRSLSVYSSLLLLILYDSETKIDHITYEAARHS